MKNKIKKGFLPIYAKNIKRLIGIVILGDMAIKILVNMLQSK
jgi:hypothetical protein